jgi:phage baseplate assembly protein W
VKTLALADGDLVLSGRGHATVDGVFKTMQDIGIALREEFGVDRFHPNWGSLLPNMIGRPFDEGVLLDVQTEVTRIVNNYLTVQRDTVLRRPQGAQVSSAEIIDKVQNIRVVPKDYGRIDVTIQLLTLDRRAFSMSMTIGA